MAPFMCVARRVEYIILECVDNNYVCRGRQCWYGSHCVAIFGVG